MESLEELNVTTSDFNTEDSPLRCKDCGDYPAIPYLDKQLCKQCLTADTSLCDEKGCYGQSVTGLIEEDLCSIHAHTKLYNLSEELFQTLQRLEEEADEINSIISELNDLKEENKDKGNTYYNKKLTAQQMKSAHISERANLTDTIETIDQLQKALNLTYVKI